MNGRTTRNKNGTNLSSEELEQAVWFDIEKRIADEEPALTVFWWLDSLQSSSTTMQIGAEYSNLVSTCSRILPKYGGALSC